MNHRLEVCPSLLIGTAGFSWLDRSEGVVLPGRFYHAELRGKILGAAWPAPSHLHRALLSRWK